jgi:hypothetical protein
MKKKLDMVACTCHPSEGGKCKAGSSQSMLVWGKSKILSQKLPEQKGLEVWFKQ